MKSQLFYTAHQLVEAAPKQAVSWFAVACYYHLLGKNELAQRYFLKVGPDLSISPCTCRRVQGKLVLDKLGRSLRCLRWLTPLIDSAVDALVDAVVDSVVDSAVDSVG